MSADAIIKTLFGLLMAILAYMGVDALRRIHLLESTYLRKSDLDDLKAQREEEHRENRSDIKDLTAAVTDTRKQITDFILDQARR